MSKCHVKELQNLWEGILEDATHAFPTLKDEFERDLSRLQGTVAHRGIRVFLEDLPAIGKHFDRCLSCGQYNASGLPLTKRRSETVVIPKFLGGLYLLVFHSSSLLKEEPNVEAIFFVRQLTLAFKKGKLACTTEANEKEVVAFFAVDSYLPEPDGFWQTTDCPISPSLHEQNSCIGDVGHLCPVSTTTHSPGKQCEGSALDKVAFRAPLRRDVVDAERKVYQGFGKSTLYRTRVQSSPAHLRKALSVLLARLDFVSNLVTSTLGSYDPSRWKFRHGPGAVSEYTGPANKYYWNNWSDALESEFPIADCGFHSYSSWADSLHSRGEVSSSELPSRMVCVPKTYSKPRLIAAEPSANQWCQQNIWHYFRDRCKSTWINNFVRFRDQKSLNQALCKKGSKDNTLATVDLSEASDRVTCHAVGQMFRGNPRLLNCLRASRTQVVSQNVTDKVPSEIRLRKFSTMGNACTFPVESLLFLSIAVATVLTQRGLRPTKRNVESLFGEVAVFGDDIVIPVECRELFVEILGVLDFKVNDRKSFWTGRFRESCGVDAFGGVDVTPAYWRIFNDGKPESLASTVGSRNNFYKKFLLSAADRLASTIPRRLYVPTVHMRSGVFGLTSFLGANVDGFKTRTNPHLQRSEVLVTSLIGCQERLPIENDSALLQYFTEDPDPLSKWSSGIPQRPKTKLRPRWVALTDLEEQFVETN